MSVFLRYAPRVLIHNIYFSQTHCDVITSVWNMYHNFVIYMLKYCCIIQILHFVHRPINNCERVKWKYLSMHIHWKFVLSCSCSNTFRQQIYCVLPYRQWFLFFGLCFYMVLFHIEKCKRMTFDKKYYMVLFKIY